MIRNSKNDKSPGPDGYNACFYKLHWNFIGSLVINSILDIFESGRIIREINHTNIVMIPKVTTSNSMADYRQIACCNFIN